MVQRAKIKFLSFFSILLGFLTTYFVTPIKNKFQVKSEEGTLQMRNFHLIRPAAASPQPLTHRPGSNRPLPQELQPSSRSRSHVRTAKPLLFREALISTLSSPGSAQGGFKPRNYLPMAWRRPTTNFDWNRSRANWIASRNC